MIFIVSSNELGLNCILNPLICHMWKEIWFAA